MVLIPGDGNGRTPPGNTNTIGHGGYPINAFTSRPETLPEYLARVATELRDVSPPRVPYFALITTPGGSVEYRPAVRFPAGTIPADARLYVLHSFPVATAKRRFVLLAPGTGEFHPDGTITVTSIVSAESRGIDRDATRPFPGHKLHKSAGGTTFTPIVKPEPRAAIATHAVAPSIADLGGIPDSPSVNIDLATVLPVADATPTPRPRRARSRS